jgi:hypothetical protein
MLHPQEQYASVNEMSMLRVHVQVQKDGCLRFKVR